MSNVADVVRSKQALHLSLSPFGLELEHLSVADRGLATRLQSRSSRAIASLRLQGVSEGSTNSTSRPKQATLSPAQLRCCNVQV